MARGCSERAAAVGLLAAFALALGCAPTAASLTIQLTSDMTPGLELDAARVTLTHDDGTAIGAPVLVTLAPGRSLGRPTRLALFDALGPETYRVGVVLSRAGRDVQSRALRVHVDGAVVRTLLMTRDCGGVACPGTGDPSAVACLGGRCVDPSCTEEDPTACGPRACTSDGDCPASAVACAPSRCSGSGVCVVTPDDALCAPSEACDAQTGCVATRARCDWSAPTFSTPTIALDMPWREASLSLSHDGLDVYFAQELGPTSTVWTAHRDTLDAAWGTPRTFDELHTAGQLEGSYTFRRDGLEVIFTREPLDASVLSDAFVAKRAHAGDPWGMPAPLTALNTTGYEFDTFLEVDGLTLWLERQDSGPGADIFRARRARVELPFEAPVPVPGLSLANRVEANPSLPDDGSFVLFTTGGAGLDLAFAPMAGDTPGAVVPLDALNASGNDAEPTVRFDGCEVLFVSDRGGTGGAAIYAVTVGP